MFQLFKKKPQEPALSTKLSELGFSTTNIELEGANPTSARRDALRAFEEAVKLTDRMKLPQAYLRFLDSMESLPSVTSGLNALLLSSLVNDEVRTLETIRRVKSISEETGRPYPAYCHYYMARLTSKNSLPAEATLHIFDLALASAREQELLRLAARIHLERASLLSDMLRPLEALAAVEEVLADTTPGSGEGTIEARWMKATILGTLGHPEAELAEYEFIENAHRAAGTAPDPQISNNRGLALRLLGKYEEALAELDESQRRFRVLRQPVSSAVEVNRSLVFIGQQRYQEALDACLLARKLMIQQGEELDAAFELNLSSAYAYLHNYTKQLEHVLAAEGKHRLTGLPPDPRFFDARADALIGLGRTEEAWAVCREAELVYEKRGMPTPQDLYLYGIDRARILEDEGQIAWFTARLDS